MVHTVEQLVAAAALIDHPLPVPRQRALGVVAMSGGAGTVVADAAGRHGVAVPDFSPATRQRIEELAPAAPVVNPVDIGAASGRSFPMILRLPRKDPGINVLAHYYHPMFTDADRARLAEQLAQSQQANGKRHLLLAPGGISDAEADAYRQAEITVFNDTDVCLAALAAAGAAPPPWAGTGPAAATAAQPLELPDGSGPIDDATGMRLLCHAGVPMAPPPTNLAGPSCSRA